MTRYLIIFLVLILLALGYLAISPKSKIELPLPQISQVDSTPTPVVTDISDVALESDITALDQDLADLQSAESTLDQELKGL